MTHKKCIKIRREMSLLIFCLKQNIIQKVMDRSKKNLVIKWENGKIKNLNHKDIEKMDWTNEVFVDDDTQGENCWYRILCAWPGGQSRRN